MVLFFSLIVLVGIILALLGAAAKSTKLKIYACIFVVIGLIGVSKSSSSEDDSKVKPEKQVERQVENKNAQQGVDNQQENTETEQPAAPVKHHYIKRGADGSLSKDEDFHGNGN